MTGKKALNILVVEDNPGDYLLLKQYIGLSLVPVKKIINAGNMAEVQALVAAESFDIVLLDLTLPDSNGIDSVITIDRLLPQIPVVVFSGLSAIEIAIESISLGAQDYLVKGEFDEKLLAKSIQYSIERKRILQHLEESNKRYGYINMATHDIIWEWDLETDHVIRNQAVSTVFGYAPGQERSDHQWWRENLHPDDLERMAAKMKYCIDNNIQTWQDEYRFRAADGSFKYVFDRAFVIFNSTGKPYRMIGAMTDITEIRKLEQELAEQQIKQQKIITEVTILAQEKERNELGKELHDNINQILATVKMYINLAIKRKGSAADLLDKSYEYVTDAIEEIRKLSHSLVTPTLGNIGLAEALTELVKEINIAKELNLQLVNEMNEAQLIDNSKELMIYRIVQEQVTNIRKHAKAKKATITLKTVGNNIHLSIADDGVGFSPGQQTKGIGLKNIQSRTEFYSGKMSLVSEPGRGCTLNITVPC